MMRVPGGGGWDSTVGRAGVGKVPLTDGLLPTVLQTMWTGGCQAPLSLQVRSSTGRVSFLP